MIEKLIPLTEEEQILHGHLFVQDLDPQGLAALYDTTDFQQNFTYTGNDLGLTFAPDRMRLRLWAPMAQGVTLRLYGTDHDAHPLAELPLDKSLQGTWTIDLPLSEEGRFYTFLVHYGEVSIETPGPYAKAVGMNGIKAQLLDLTGTDPEGFRTHEAPKLSHAVDAVVYEVHVRDFSIHKNSGILHKGKYLGFTEKDTVNEEGLATGLAHLQELGVTHVQLLPIFDFNALDESRDDGEYNWGYDPLNYNAPEGSYATNPSDPATRIRELKELIQALHEAGIGVIMDVVYNHTFSGWDTPLNHTAPLYFHRTLEGKFTDASACGNETASERPMMRKFILDSLLHYVREYRMDGFRFDLMGIHDTETLRQAEALLRKENPQILLYGEGWTGGESPLAEEKRLIKKNIGQVPGIGVFSDDFRDAVKGHVFYAEKGGFISGEGFADSLTFGVAGAVPHPDTPVKAILYADAPWAVSPGQSVNYVSAHDNLTLYDKLKACHPTATEENLKDRCKLAEAIVLTSQGMPFLHAGTEFLRTKFGDENSYRSPDRINALNWAEKTRHRDVFTYLQGLIALRKAHGAFRLKTAEEIQKHLVFLQPEKTGLLHLKGKKVLAYYLRDPQKEGTYFVAYNGSSKVKTLPLAPGPWSVLCDKNQASAHPFRKLHADEVLLRPLECLVLYSATPLPDHLWSRT